MRSPQPHCSTCGALVYWSDDAWTCIQRHCGNEWNQDHSVEYVAPAEQPEWEAVKDPYDRRRVVYWRLVFRNGLVGSIARRGGRWRALGYGRITKPPNGNVELGSFADRIVAEDAVVQHWIKNWSGVKTDHTRDELGRMSRSQLAALAITRKVTVPNPATITHPALVALIADRQSSTDDGRTPSGNTERP